MIKQFSGFVAALAIPLLSGCAAGNEPPLVFVQTTSVGITAATTGGQATPELTVGYRDVDVAIVPVTQSNGQPIRSAAPGTGNGFQDALSVLGQFSVGSDVTGAPKATLGKFFSTGSAASLLAEGYRCQFGATGNNDPSKCIVH